MLQKLESFVRTPDWRLTTAEILYHLPDHPGVLQTFIWQKLDRGACCGIAAGEVLV